MSTVKIKTESTATAVATAAAAAVDVKVKLEPCLSATAGIKLEQHTSDIDTKVESDSEADSEEDNIKSEGDDDQDQSAEAPSSRRQFICKHPRCGRSFNNASYLRMHQHEHKLQTEFYVHGKTYTLIRQSLNDRWPCPIPNCKVTYKTVAVICVHLRRGHGEAMGQEHHSQQPPTKNTRHTLYFVDVNDFYVCGNRCGYHNTIGVFICYKCRLVPECLLTHLQQNHGYGGMSIDNAILPESAANASVDPNSNQHTSNSHLVSATRQPYRHHHRDIVQGWMCITSNCRYCGYSSKRKNEHSRNFHQQEEFLAVPALVLRLVFTKTQSCCFLITRIGQESGAVTTSSSRENQEDLDYSHNRLDSHDENGNDIDQNETTDKHNQKQQWKCDYPNCGCFFGSSAQLSLHQHDHRLQTELSVHGKTYILRRQSLDDRWPCPIPDCDKTCKTVDTCCRHIRNTHSIPMKQKRANSEDDDNDQQQQQIIKRVQRTIQYLKVNDFYICGMRCGYHNATGVFLCYNCKLVPECLLTHLQQKHGFDENSLDDEFLPERARVSKSDPSINQHVSNPHLASAIRDPCQWYHPDIVHGWQCVTSDCGYCGFTVDSKVKHKRKFHQGEQFSTVPALVLRLLYGKIYTSCFLIIRLDTAASSTNSNNPVDQYNSGYEYDDGDELVLSDMGEDDDI